MDKVTGKLTVYYDDSFWVGIFERNEGNKQERKVKNREEKAAKEQRQFELKQQKKKAKRRGH